MHTFPRHTSCLLRPWRILPLATVLLAPVLLILAAPALAQEAQPHEGEGLFPRAAHQQTVRPTDPAPAPPTKQAPVKPAPPKQAPAKQGAGAPSKAAVAKPTAHTPGPAVKNDGKRYLRSLDENHDGRITQKEFLSRTQERYDALDLNHDGFISPEEASQAKAAQVKKKAEREARKKLLARGKNKKNVPQAMPQAEAETTAKPSRPVKPPLARLDADGDGRVTRQEFLAKRQDKFAEMDLNHDGVISREEAKVAKAKVLARRAELRAEQKERAARLAEQAAARAEKAALKDARKQRSAEIAAEKEARAGRKRDKLARKAQAEWGLNMDPPEELQQDQPAPR